MLCCLQPQDQEIFEGYIKHYSPPPPLSMYYIGEKAFEGMLFILPVQFQKCVDFTLKCVLNLFWWFILA